MIVMQKVLGPEQPLGEAPSKEWLLLGTLFFLMQTLCLCLVWVFCLSVYDCDAKRTGTSTTSRRSSSDLVMRLAKRSVNDTDQEKC